jgi:hypothetical protein
MPGANIGLLANAQLRNTMGRMSGGNFGRLTAGRMMGGAGAFGGAGVSDITGRVIGFNVNSSGIPGGGPLGGDDGVPDGAEDDE